MSRKRFKRQENNGGGPQGWMTTFSDLMSLLLTFFILLYSMSTIDAQKFKDITSSLQAVLSGVGQPVAIDGGYDSSIEVPIDDLIERDENIKSDVTTEKIRVMYDKVTNYVLEQGLDAKVSVTSNKRGVFVDIKEAILFEPGKAELKESGVQILKQLKGLVNDFDNEIVIEGHTDDVPMKSPLYPSNWELSTARGVSVVRYLSEVEDIDPVRLSAIGYGEYRPIAPNNGVLSRAANRRVNILIIITEESEDVNGNG